MKKNPALEKESWNCWEVAKKMNNGNLDFENCGSVKN